VISCEIQGNLLCIGNVFALWKTTETRKAYHTSSSKG